MQLIQRWLYVRIELPDAVSQHNYHITPLIPVQQPFINFFNLKAWYYEYDLFSHMSHMMPLFGSFDGTGYRTNRYPESLISMPIRVGITRKMNST